jgi:zinc/manganese transport system permease protein
MQRPLLASKPVNGRSANMMDSLQQLMLAPFSDYQFMRRALVACCAMALGGTPVGLFMTLRNMSLSGDAISHAILPGVAAGYLLGGLSLLAMTLGGLLAGLLVALLSVVVTRSSNSREDTSLAAFYLMSLALGVLLVSRAGSNVDLEHALFGTLIVLDGPTLTMLAAIASVSVATVAVYYRPLLLECCDSSFLRSVSKHSAPAHAVLLLLIVLNLVMGFHAMGTLMAVGMMILPAAAARFWSSELPVLLLLALLFCLLGSVCGLLYSFHANAPASSAIILTLGLLYLLSYGFGTGNGLYWRYFPLSHLDG